ncbi:MAG: hypothetical protein E7561_02645 [Ruminococcaceae bacterium]|nr:hypothetical protein [Oscillospiraceae bacterium]
MKKLKKAIIVFLCVLMAFSSLGIVSHAKSLTWSTTITIDNVTATPGDTVYVNVNLSDNVYGIMAMTFSILYDNNVLSYVGYQDGKLNYKDKNGVTKTYGFFQYYINDRGDYISIVDCENKNQQGSGTLITLEFKVKDNAAAGTYSIKMANVRPYEKGESLKGCFANWYGDTINPVLTNGSITIPLTQKNCQHNFGSWTKKTDASCVNEGIEVRNCSICGKLENRMVSKTDHFYDKNWTVDTVATADEDGILSRHCTVCNKKTDYKFFTYSSAVQNDVKNEVGAELTKAEVDLLESLEADDIENNNPDSSNLENGNNENDNSNPSGDISEEIPENAGVLVEVAKKENTAKTGIAGRIYDYLYGTKSGAGIINVILKALKEFFQELFKN